MIRPDRADERLHRRWRRHAVLLVLAVAGAAAAVSAFVTAEVVARGRLVPSGGAGVRRVRVWDAVEFYISSETALPPTDVLTALVFAVLATAVGFAALVLWLAGKRDERTTFFALAAAGAGFLTADELLAVHESIGHNLQFLRRIPHVERPDDLVLLAYVFPALLVGWWYRAVIGAVPGVVWVLAAAIAASVGVGLADLVGIGSWEERGEGLTAVLLAIAFVWLAAVHVARTVHGDTVSSSPGTRGRSG